MEHTRIESYPGQTTEHAAITALFPRGGPELVGRSDAGRYRLSVPLGSFASVRPNDRMRVSCVLTEWIATHLDQIPEVDGASRQPAIRGSHAEVPFKWALYRSIPSNIGVVGFGSHCVGISHSCPPDLENLRKERLSTSITEKVPKLLDAAGGQRRSLLVLEERDVTLSNPASVTVALRAVSSGLRLPDAIYLVNVRMGNPLACVVWENGEWADQTPTSFHWLTFPVDRLIQFNPINRIWP